MPQIPAVSGPTVQQQVVSQPLARSVDISSGTRALGQAVEGVGQDLFKMRDKQEKAEANSALQSFEQEKNEILFNPDNGYYNTQGRNAVDGLEPAQKKLDETLKRYRDSFENPRIAGIFDAAANARIVRDQQGMLTHSNKGQRVWDLGNAKAELDTSVNNANLYYNDPERLKIQITSAELAVHDAANITGTDPKIALVNARSAVVKSAIDGALSRKDYDTAESLREQYDKLLANDTDRVAADKSITAARDKQAVAGHVADIYNPVKPLNEMLKEARQIEDKDQRKSVETQLGNMFTRDEKARNQVTEEMFNDAALKIEQGQSYADLEIQNPALMESLSPSERESLRSVESRRMKRELVVTDESTKNNLLGMTSEQLITTKPSDYVNLLNTKDYSSYIERRRRAVEGQENEEDKFGRTKSTALNSTIKQIYGKKPDPEQINAFSKFVGDQAAVENVQSMQQYEELLARAASKFVIEKPLWFDDNDATIKKIPAEHLPAIADELRRTSKPVTPENMFFIYKSAKDRGLIE